METNNEENQNIEKLNGQELIENINLEKNLNHGQKDRESEL